MSIYKELVEFINNHGLTLRHGSIYDSQSGWTSEGIYVYDGDKCLTNMTGNGFMAMVSEESAKKTLRRLKKYISEKELKTSEDFINYVKKYGEEAKGDCWPELDYGGTK